MAELPPGYTGHSVVTTGSKAGEHAMWHIIASNARRGTTGMHMILLAQAAGQLRLKPPWFGMIPHAADGGPLDAQIPPNMQEPCFMTDLMKFQGEL